jgi:nitrogenase molybdenum-iron protein beta chain
LTRHYKEPVMAGTSSFTEGASVFGGQANLLQAIQTLFTVYKPRVIAVHTTCLSETIGDDITQIAAKAKEEGKVPEGKYVIHANTPSYVGSHVTGFSTMTRKMAESFARKTGQPNGKINLIPGWVEPSDMREIKRITSLMKIPIILFPDTSGVVDGPLTGEYKIYPNGGVTVEELQGTADSKATIALGPLASGAAAESLDSHFGVPCEVLDLPIGLLATDRFVDTLRTTAMVEVPAQLEEERGRLLDVMSDMHQYFFGKRVALYGDPDQLVALSEFLVTLDMKPVYVVTGTPGKKFEERMTAVLGSAVPDAKVRQGAGADMYLLHQWIKQEKVDLLIGNTYGKYIARDEDIPFVRYGFPILDRVGHSYFPSVGYMGGVRLAEMILDALMDRQDRDALEEKFELVI